MIKIKPEVFSTFKATIKLTPFGADAEDVVIEYQYMPTSKAMEMSKEKTVGQALQEMVKGWDGIDGKFSPEALTELIDHNPAMGMELFQGYFAALAETRAKN